MPGPPSAFPMPFGHVCHTQDNVEIVMFNKQLYGPSKIFEGLGSTTRKKGSKGKNTQTSGRGRRLDAPRRSGDVSAVRPWRVGGGAAHSQFGRRLASQRRRLSDSECIVVTTDLASTTVKPLEKDNGQDGFVFCIPVYGLIDICGSITMHLKINVPLKADLCLEQRSVELSPQPNLKIILHVRAGGGGGHSAAPLATAAGGCPYAWGAPGSDPTVWPCELRGPPSPYRAADASTACGAPPLAHTGTRRSTSYCSRWPRPASASKL